MEYGKEWRIVRKKALERDSYVCQRCFSKHNLHVHHKNRAPFNELKFLITLCSSCHRKEHWREDYKILKQLMVLYLEAKREFENEYETSEEINKNEKLGICSDCKKKKKTEFHHLSYEPNILK